MKLILISFLLVSICFPVLSQPDNAPFRIFGQISTVDNQTLTGYMIWNKNKNCWIDLFEAEKTHNSYTHYFDTDDEVVFKNKEDIFAHPHPHFLLPFRKYPDYPAIRREGSFPGNEKRTKLYFKKRGFPGYRVRQMSL